MPSGALIVMRSSSSTPMNLEAFLTEGTPVWQRLEGLLARAGRRPERLRGDGVLELGSLYRVTVADLALARREFPGDPVLERLEPLTLRARQLIYGERRRRGSARTYLTRTYWQEIRANHGLLALSLAATFVPALLAGIWGIVDP